MSGLSSSLVTEGIGARKSGTNPPFARQRRHLLAYCGEIRDRQASASTTLLGMPILVSRDLGEAWGSACLTSSQLHPKCVPQCSQEVRGSAKGTHCAHRPTAYCGGRGSHL